MVKPIPEETRARLEAVIKEAYPNATNFRHTQLLVCDHCQKEDREAFPYYVLDREGRYWADLCNQCFDFLGCDDEQLMGNYG